MNIHVYDLFERGLFIGAVEVRVWDKSDHDYEVLLYSENAETINIHEIENREVVGIYTIRNGIIAVEVKGC